MPPRRESAARAASRPPRRKRFGQHFLHDPAVIERIVTAIRPEPQQHLVEIGPGRGALTRRLLQGGPASLDAIELDRDLAAQLTTELSGSPGFTLHVQDALRVDFTDLARQRGARLRIIGNLPYNISTPLLFHLLQHADAIDDLHIMLQREVVARMAAVAGDADYGRLSVMLAPWSVVHWLFDVGPGAFQPPPRVWSAVARVQIRREPAFKPAEHFAEVVSAAFSHRRKTLRNALRALVSEEQIRAAGQDPGVRPETLEPSAFNAIAQKIVRSTSGCA
ncbi:MAG: 16S rRNA (adenine(1518)-N(6)/adenine(1519)-N(6))-dimethyltransferase RsmA [Sinobacteraceae bacterium]|nr:16S rRNA (adenine(1518)-N(6)/adenine(1519)-N(6))-dimethyltransferase RsmA [Nevskiaceae bacterium]